jgi:hypothetical protein
MIWLTLLTPAIAVNTFLQIFNALINFILFDALIADD